MNDNTSDHIKEMQRVQIKTTVSSAFLYFLRYLEVIVIAIDAIKLYKRPPNIHVEQQQLVNKI